MFKFLFCCFLSLAFFGLVFLVNSHDCFLFLLDLCSQKERVTMADVDESESKPKILVLGGLWVTTVVDHLNGRGLSFVFSSVLSDFKDSQGILFYLESSLVKRDFIHHAAASFEKRVLDLGGIDGIPLYIWSLRIYFDRKEEMVERLRLKERGCIWEIGFGHDVLQNMDQFFQENLQTILKPAREK